MNIRFDEQNLLADVAGRPNGLTRSDIGRSGPRALKALPSFRRQRPAAKLSA